MSRPRLVISDIDRTLLTHSHVLLPVVKDAVHRAMAAGLNVVLASARSPQGVHLVQRELGLSGPTICFNGGWTGIPANGEVWDSHTLSLAAAAIVAAKAAAAGLTPMWFIDGAVLALTHQAGVAERQAAVTQDVLELRTRIEDFSGAPYKIMIVVPLDRMGEATGLLGDVGGGVRAVRSGSNLIEVVRTGVSKASAAAALARRWGLHPAEIAAAGDNDNDVELLAWASLAASVANGTAEAQRLANFIGGTCDEGGIAAAFEWLMSLPATSADARGSSDFFASFHAAQSGRISKKEKTK